MDQFTSLNHKAFGNIFHNSQKSFYTSARTSDPKKKGYRSFLQLNNGIFIHKNVKVTPRHNFYDFVNQYTIVELEKWSIAPIIHPIHRFKSRDWLKEGHMAWISFDHVHFWKLIHVC